MNNEDYVAPARDYTPPSVRMFMQILEVFAKTGKIRLTIELRSDHD